VSTLTKARVTSFKKMCVEKNGARNEMNLREGMVTVNEFHPLISVVAKNVRK